MCSTFGELLRLPSEALPARTVACPHRWTRSPGASANSRHGARIAEQSRCASPSEAPPSDERGVWWFVAPTAGYMTSSGRTGLSFG